MFDFYMITCCEQRRRTQWGNVNFGIRVKALKHCFFVPAYSKMENYKLIYCVYLAQYRNTVSGDVFNSAKVSETEF
jgi:hypothetical protein